MAIETTDAKKSLIRRVGSTMATAIDHEATPTQRRRAAVATVGGATVLLAGAGAAGDGIVHLATANGALMASVLSNPDARAGLLGFGVTGVIGTAAFAMGAGLYSDTEKANIYAASRRVSAASRLVALSAAGLGGVTAIAGGTHLIPGGLAGPTETVVFGVAAAAAGAAVGVRLLGRTWGRRPAAPAAALGER